MSAAAESTPHTLVVNGVMTPEYEAILTLEVQAFIAELADRFAPQRDALLKKRLERQKAIDEGAMPDFLTETREVRESDWEVAPIPEDLKDRRVEITGPVDRKMVINALNSGAKVFMADFEDSLTPTWHNVMEGHLAMHGAVRRKLEYVSPEGKQYSLGDNPAVLIVRPRGWHLNEQHVLCGGRTVPGALFDFGVHFYVNAKEALSRGTGPYFYLPKLESHEEARLWAEVFAYGEERLGLKKGTIKATVLIETILAAFEMDEILYELKDYCVGLNCGRWDYIFSFIKKFSKNKEYVLPDRSQVTMTTHFLRSYSKLLIKTCHRRGAFAMGGMAAFIPVKDDEAANERAFAAVKADKEREAGDGHDGTWVAHPGLIPVAMEVFERLVPGRNQVSRQLDDVSITAADLLAVPPGKITEEGMRNNISVGLQYIASWLSGNGCVPINNLMEDAATAEIARAQIWQWIHHDKGVLDNGHDVTIALFDQYLDEELGKIRKQLGEAEFAKLPFDEAAKLLSQLVSQWEFAEFLTLPAYNLMNRLSLE